VLHIWLVILLVVDALSLLLVFVGLPGNWVMVALTCLFAWWQWDRHPFSAGILIVIVVLALLGELVEFVAGMVGARRSGTSWWASILAIFGAIAGGLCGTFLIPIPLLGSVVGASLGAGLTVWVTEMARGQQIERSVRRAVGAGMGQFLGTMSKFAIGVVIWLVIVIAALRP
jgi:uncharacterized protein YqgC (DUF456 family)